MKNYIPVTFSLHTHSIYAFPLSILFLVHFMPNFWGSKVSLFVDILLEKTLSSYDDEEETLSMGSMESWHGKL